MSIETYIIEAPSHWASYLINCDPSGYDDADLAAADAHFDGLIVLDCDLETARFTWSADLYGSTSAGDEICEYTVTAA
jgi:hypothetical protein